MSERNSQIFDDVFRSMEEHVPSIMIPLINEVFGTSYAKDEPVTRLGDNHHLTGRATDWKRRLQRKTEKHMRKYIKGYGKCQTMY